MSTLLFIPVIIMTNFQKTWYDEIYELETKFPQLFIYSTGDDIIDYKGTLSKFSRNFTVDS